MFGCTKREKPSLIQWSACAEKPAKAREAVYESQLKRAAISDKLQRKPAMLGIREVQNRLMIPSHCSR
jgi:hypothetical protein